MRNESILSLRTLILAGALAGAIILSASDVDAQGTCFDQQLQCQSGCIGIGLDPDLVAQCICVCGLEYCECEVEPDLVGICLAGISDACSGLTQSDPVLPDVVLTVGGFEFFLVVGGQWVDPPLTDSFTYTMTGESLFTEIIDFPTGFSQPFTVSVGEQVLGQFGPGDSLVFPGGGVPEFVVSDISPAVDAEQGDAFPLRLDFDTPTAGFTMTVPEPSMGMTLVPGIVALSVLRRIRLRRYAASGQSS